jgi:hypothetical protein
MKPTEDLESEYQCRLEYIYVSNSLNLANEEDPEGEGNNGCTYEERHVELRGAQRGVDKDASREDFPNLHSKIIKDKHCW